MRTSDESGSDFKSVNHNEPEYWNNGVMENMKNNITYVNTVNILNLIFILFNEV